MQTIRLECPTCKCEFIPRANRPQFFCTKKCEKRSRLYKAWENMKARCYSASYKRRKNYNYVHITVCDEWRQNFPAFYKWAIENGYSDSLTLDRKNPRRNYEPSNCRWATQSTQTRNQQKMRRGCTSVFKGVSRNVKTQRWMARIGGLYLGIFNSELEAARCYDMWARRLHGEAARINFPEAYNAPAMGAKE